MQGSPQMTSCSHGLDMQRHICSACASPLQRALTVVRSRDITSSYLSIDRFCCDLQPAPSASERSESVAAKSQRRQPPVPCYMLAAQRNRARGAGTEGMRHVNREGEGYSKN